MDEVLAAITQLKKNKNTNLGQFIVKTVGFNFNLFDKMACFEAIHMAPAFSCIMTQNDIDCTPLN